VFVIDIHLHHVRGGPRGDAVLVARVRAEVRIVRKRELERGVTGLLALLRGEDEIPGGLQPQGCPRKEAVGHQQPGRAQGAHEGRVFVRDQHRAREAFEMARHGAVERHPAGEYEGGGGVQGGEDRVHDVAGQSRAQALGDFGQVVALLLGVDEVGLGEDRAAAGNGRGVADEREGGHLGGGDPQSIELLVQERPRAGSTGGVGVIVQDGTVGVEAHQLDMLGPEDHEAAPRARLTQEGDLGRQSVYPPGLQGAAVDIA